MSWLPVAALLAAVPVTRAQSPGHNLARVHPTAEPKNFTFREDWLRSQAVGREVPFGIYLPKGYDEPANKDVKYPLVIWLHGMHEDHVRFTHESCGGPALDRAVEQNKLPPCVVVTANGGPTSMYVNRKDERWEDLITVDLLDHVARHYRVRPEREQRAIMGVSMGGMGALRIAFTKPELFGAVGAHSAAVFAEDPGQLPEQLKSYASRLGFDEVFGKPIQKEAWQRANPLCIATVADVAKLRTLRIYFDAGTDDRYGFAAGNQLLHEALEKRGVPHTFRRIDGGGHSWRSTGFVDNTLPHSFAMVGAMFRGKTSAAAANAIRFPNVEHPSTRRWTRAASVTDPMAGPAGTDRLRTFGFMRYGRARSPNPGTN